MKISKKIIAVVLSVLMILSVMPFAASAADEPYLTFTGTASFSIKTGNSAKNWNGTLEYSTDKNTWTTWDGTQISSDNDKLYLRGTGNTQITGSIDDSRCWVITTEGKVACSGDIRTLLDYDDPEYTDMGAYCFSNLFKNWTSLTAAPELPATILAKYCYAYMFNGCTSLTTAPELWATSLTEECYSNMFDGCTSLTTAPELPAIDLADYCYNSMFQGCTSLTTPSELPATTLTKGCYRSMFQGCTGIKLSTEQTAEYSTPYSIPKEGTGSVGSNSLSNMFSGTGGTFTTGTPAINKTYYIPAPAPAYTDGFMVGDDHYDTFAEAYAAAQDGDTITFLENATIDSTYTINDGRNIIIDLNGKTISSTVRMFNVRHGGLEFTGTGTVNATFASANAAVAVYGSTNAADADYATFKLGENVTMTATNGYGAMIGANSKAAYGAKLTINGTIDSKYGVYVNGNVQEPADKTNAAQVTINGTVGAGEANTAVYAAGYAKWTVNEGATIEGGSGIYIKSGDLVVNGGTITATGVKTAYAFNPNGANGTGDGIIIDSCGYPGNVPTVAINGGSISSTNGDAVASYTKQDDSRYSDATFERVDEVIPATSTAVFSSDVSALADDGYRTVYDETKGGYIVDDANNGYFLTIGERIVINFALDVASFKAEGGRIVVNGVNANEESSAKSDKTYSISALETVTGGAYDGNVIVSLEVAPAQLAEGFTISVYGEDGDLKGTVEASVYEYANSMKADATYGELMTALINYGALAKDYFNYDGAEITPAEGYNTDLTAAEKNELISRRAAGLTTGNASFDGMVYFAKVEPEFKFYFVNTNAGTAQLSDNDLSVVLTKTDNGVAAKVTGFKASDFGKTFSVTVDGTTLTVNGYAYIASALKSDSLKSLATGLFRYAQAAEALA